MPIVLTPEDLMTFSDPSRHSHKCVHRCDPLLWKILAIVETWLLKDKSKETWTAEEQVSRQAKSNQRNQTKKNKNNNKTTPHHHHQKKAMKGVSSDIQMKRNGPELLSKIWNLCFVPSSEPFLIGTDRKLLRLEVSGWRHPESWPKKWHCWNCWCQIW